LHRCPTAFILRKHVGKASFPEEVDGTRLSNLGNPVQQRFALSL
jgi:hypothetical protein